MIDIAAVDIKDAIGDVVLGGAPEFIGRLVQVLCHKGVISASELQGILPAGYLVINA